MKINLENNNTKLPKACTTKYCPSGRNKQRYWKQDALGTVYCMLCGANLGMYKKGLLDFHPEAQFSQFWSVV